MGYQRSDDRYGGRWREQGRYGHDGDRGRFRDEDDRGFFQRIADEIRARFWDDDDDDRYRRDRGGYRPVYSRRERSRSDFDNDFGDWRSEDYIPSGSGFGGPAQGFDRRFDRIDAGSTGTHGADPVTAPAGSAYGDTAGGFGGTTGRRRAIYEQSLVGAYGRGYGATSPDRGPRTRAGDIHDPHYREWRDRQIADLDRDYDEYRREHQSKFDREFGTWREKRQSQRQLIGKVTEHMEVVGSDGQHVGTVDCVKGDRIILTKSDEAAGGRHHSIPCGWVESVKDKVKMNISAEQAKQAWRDEERRSALFDSDDQGGEGPHVLNRSFSGTY
jgi:hypothetical protein